MHFLQKCTTAEYLVCNNYVVNQTLKQSQYRVPDKIRHCLRTYLNAEAVNGRKRLTSGRKKSVISIYRNTRGC